MKDEFDTDYMVIVAHADFHFFRRFPYSTEGISSSILPIVTLVTRIRRVLDKNLSAVGWSKKCSIFSSISVKLYPL